MANGERTTKAKKIINRMKEPSTWAGLGVLAALFGVPMAEYQAVATAGAALAGALAIFLPEAKAKA